MTRIPINRASANGSSGLIGRREHEQADIHGTPGFQPALSQRPAEERIPAQMMSEMRMTYLIRARELQHQRQQDHQHLMAKSVQHAAQDGQTLILAIHWTRSVDFGVMIKTMMQANATQQDDDQHDHGRHDHQRRSRVLR